MNAQLLGKEELTDRDIMKSTTDPAKPEEGREEREVCEEVKVLWKEGSC